MSRFIRPALNLVILAGLAIAVWPVGQTLYGRWSQHALAAQWQAQQRDAKHHPAPVHKTSSKKNAPVQGHIEAVSQHGVSDPNSPTLARTTTRAKKYPTWPLTKISIPDIGLETYVVQGQDPASLRRGPGHDPDSALPGEGNCVIAGHRNVYGSYFYRLDELLPGASIVLENKNGTWNYTVSSVYVTPDTDLSVLAPPPPNTPAQLTLITCTLPHSSSRIVLLATLNEE